MSIADVLQFALAFLAGANTILLAMARNGRGVLLHGASAAFCTWSYIIQ